MISRFESIVLGLLTLTGATTVVAQGEPPPAPVFGETVEVRVVNVEVTVTDRDGVPVTGLSGADFRLLVDGEEVPVRYFTEILGGTAVAPDASTAGTIAGVPALSPGEPVATNYLVFVDDFFAIGRDRDRVLDALRYDLGRLGPEDRMAIVAFDGSQLELLSSWTNSTRDLERALGSAKARSALGLQRLAERRNFTSERSAQRRTPGFGSPGLGGIQGGLEPGERFFADTLERQLTNVVSAAASALRGFANPPGRKVLLLLAGGWPYEIDEYVSQEFVRAVREPGMQHGDRLYAPLVDTANQVGYSIFAIDVPGLGSDSVGDASYVDLPDDSERFSSFVRENNQQFTLQRVASETGGLALLNAGRLEALERAAAATRTYYWLGFTPPWRGDDKRHDVAVEVRREDLRVGSRGGYVDFSQRAVTSAAVESVLLFGSPPGARQLALEIGKSEKSKGRTMLVPIVLSIPTGELVLLAEGSARVAALELRVAAIDEQGGRSEIPVIPIRLSYPGEPPAGTRATYRTSLELRRTKNRLVVAVYDPVAGTLWSATTEVRP